MHRVADEAAVAYEHDFIHLLKSPYMFDYLRKIALKCALT